ncbi:MAG: sensor histidine kinase [SAR202 cluster bacterium]|nr:sensor histidine kinase [SAR202 cluster bacterium]
MNTKPTTSPFQEAGKGLKRLASSLAISERSIWLLRSNAKGRQPDAGERYVVAVLQSLAVFRLVSFALGSTLVFFLNPSDLDSLALGSVVLGVGMFNVYRILWRFDPSNPRLFIEWGSLCADVALSITMILVSGGLDSPFLIYSLSPVLTASLLLTMRGAVAIALVLALSVSGAHIAAGLDVNDLPWLLSRNYLVLSLLYSAVCLLVVSLPFLANLNWQHRVRSESLASERQRLRRDVHDNVAQTLAFLSLKMKLASQRSSEGRSPITEQDVADISSIVERTYLTVRDYLDGNEEENQEPLHQQLSAIASQWNRDTGLSAKLDMDRDEEDLNPTVKFQLLQVTREALANVAKHAYPDNVWVSLKCSNGNVNIRVKDDGRGFASTELRGHGMGIMSERAAMAGANLSIESSPGNGTTVTIEYTRNAERVSS